jgi:hypothetical protein
MGKHIADTPSERTSEGRLKHYTEIERRNGADPSSREKAMHRQPKAPGNEGERLKRYVETDRNKD